MNNPVKTTIVFFILLIISSCSIEENNSTETIVFKRNSDQTGIYESDPNGTTYKMLSSDTATYRLKLKPSIPSERFQSLQISNECYSGDICVDWTLDQKGTKQYSALTKRNLNNQIFYVIEGKIVAAPFVGGVIKTGKGQFPMSKVHFDSLFVSK